MKSVSCVSVHILLADANTIERHVFVDCRYYSNLHIYYTADIISNNK